MKVLRLNQDALPDFNHPVITIGAFDGFHLGHREIVNQVCQLAEQNNSDSVLITFDPHPRKILDQENTHPYLLSTTEEKIKLLSETSLKYVILVPFNFEFSQQIAEEYIENFIIRQFKPHTLVIGFDHRFGMNSEGDLKLLRKYAAQGNFELKEISKQELKYEKISSTQIRDAIRKNEFRLVTQLLGKPYLISGQIVKGMQIGNKLGYPTANLELGEKSKLIPNSGIYAALAHLEGVIYRGLLYIGNRPTLGSNMAPSIEIHLKDFNGDLYQKNMLVEIIDYIREDEKFDDLTLLKEQIQRDDQKINDVLDRYMITMTNQMKDPKIAVVILNYNGENILKEYLPSVFDHLPHHTELYLIDNASTDQSLLWVKQSYPEIKIVRLSKNYGFAEGYNRGLKQVNADYFILLNSDVRVTNDWISPLIRRVQSNPRIMACQPKILSSRHPDQFEYAGAAGGLIDLLGYTFSRGRMMHSVEADSGQYNDARPIFWASGAAFLVNAAMFRAIGGFDGDYFAHQEEIDLCWRIQRAGGEIWYEPESKVFHLGGGTLDYSNPKKVFLNFRNNLSTIFKNTPYWYLVLLLPLRLILDVLISIRYLWSGKIQLTLKVIEAYVWSILSTLWLIQKKENNSYKINQLRIGPEKLKGVLKGSLFVHYYLFNHQTYKNIPNQYKD
ncbi:MAG: bifunctional riboflavin kinase/FAD synthetase [Saprospiraceae bacterium]|nr:bifunctional riboflavin kinase/FAD synthetase [Saprospiraceae bacterium]